MAVKQTGNSLREERVLGGRLRYWTSSFIAAKELLHLYFNSEDSKN